MITQPPIPPRIAEVLAVDYLDGLEQRATDEVRAMRDTCREAAARLSYNRRVLQGQLDVARAEVARRAAGDDRPLVESLERVLADADGITHAPGPMAAVVGEPDDLGADLDWLPLSTLPDLDDDALAQAVTRAAAHEVEVSRWRRVVLDALDRLQGELIGRYRDGDATVDEVMPG